tara:strand:+ start:137 stop:673 length:537 start_codon:yes stop_codon:yes gene_type:complete
MSNTKKKKDYTGTRNYTSKTNLGKFAEFLGLKEGASKAQIKAKAATMSQKVVRQGLKRAGIVGLVAGTILDVAGSKIAEQANKAISAIKDKNNNKLSRRQEKKLPKPKPKPKSKVTPPKPKPKKKTGVITIEAQTLLTPSKYKKENGKQAKITYNQRFKEIKKEKALKNLKKIIKGRT